MPNQLVSHNENCYKQTMSARSRSRRRHVQQPLFNCGGKRRGAGRKPGQGRSRTSHKKRNEITGEDVLHVVLRAVCEVGNLRRREVYKAVRAATKIAARTAERQGQFRIVHLSIQHNHIHMLVEAERAKALARGMHAFQISAARRINTALRVGARRRRGSVFADRYHVVVIRSPRQTRHVLAYLLGNWRKHGEDRYGVPRTWLVDPFSTAILFPDWKEREGQPPWTIPLGYEPLVVTEARSWLLRTGWRTHAAISVYEVPGQRARRR